MSNPLSSAIRSFNRRFFNRLILRSAGSARSPFAVLHHVGRRSGKSYRTPIIAMRADDRFIFELTYGTEVDWYRNVLAAGHCTLRWHGRDYLIENPQPVPAEVGLQAFPLPARLLLRLMRRRHFFSMTQRVEAPESTGFRSEA